MGCSATTATCASAPAPTPTTTEAEPLGEDAPAEVSLPGVVVTASGQREGRQAATPNSPPPSSPAASQRAPSPAGLPQATSSRSPSPALHAALGRWGSGEAQAAKTGRVEHQDRGKDARLKGAATPGSNDPPDDFEMEAVLPAQRVRTAEEEAVLAAARAERKELAAKLRSCKGHAPIEGTVLSTEDRCAEYLAQLREMYPDAPSDLLERAAATETLEDALDLVLVSL